MVQNVACFSSQCMALTAITFRSISSARYCMSISGDRRVIVRGPIRKAMIRRKNDNPIGANKDSGVVLRDDCNTYW